MKRIAMAMVAVLLMVALVVTASAASNNFINSVAQVGKPVLQGNPEIAEGVYLLLTSYSDRATLPDDGAKMEEAYGIVNSASDLTALNAGLATAAANMGLQPSDLVVSDLFDLSLIYERGGFVLDEELLAQYTTVTVSLKADLLDRFVGLLHYVNGKFEHVDNAHVENGNLVFTVDTLSPFAIIVHREGANPGGESGQLGGESGESPDTGDTTPWGYAVVMGTAALLGCLLFVRRKQTAE